MKESYWRKSASTEGGSVAHFRIETNRRNWSARRSARPTELASLHADQAQSQYAARLESGLSAGAVLIVHRLLHKAPKDGMRWGLLGRNVIDTVIAPKVGKAEIRVWSSDDAMTILRATAEDRLHQAYTISLYRGSGAGHPVGLRWEDVDLITGRLQIRRDDSAGARAARVCHRRSEERVEPPANCAAGDGDRVAPPSTDSAKGRKARGRRGLAGDRLRLHAGEWDGLRASNYKRSFKAAVKRIAVPMIRVPDLRHTCATLLLSREVHPKIGQELFGNSQISLTMDTYSHVLPTMQEEAARTIAAVLGYG